MSVKEQTIADWQPPKQRSWRSTLSSLRKHSQSKLLTGSFIMLAGSALVSLLNFGYNIEVAHLLGPDDFSHAAAAVTLLMLASCINLAFQLVSAKLIARNQDPRAKAAVYQQMARYAWFVGAALTATLFLVRGSLAEYLRMPSAYMIDVLALGMLFYIPLGVRRGAMQGTCQFVRLSLNLAAEACSKFFGAVIFIVLGMGTMGAVFAISFSVFVAFLLPNGDAQLRVTPEGREGGAILEGVQAIIFFVGQVVINNIDILMVKHYFPPSEAGLYAAVALVGRLLYFATWSVTSAMFPISAGATVEREGRRVLAIPLLFVTGLSAVFVLILASFPDLVINVLFGSGFHEVSARVRELLTMNAVATGIYALAVVLITYEMSRRIANTGWFQLAVSLMLVAGVAAFHGSLMEVIVVQQVLRLVLLVGVSVPFVFRQARGLGQEAV
jgi:O-antigen/teichoic acid export membrane protein